MAWIIILVSLAIVGLGLLLLVKPRALDDFVASVDQGKVRYSIALLRIVLGCLFLATAAASRWPFAITVVGWVTVVAGLLAVVVTRGFLESIQNVYRQVPGAVIRGGALFVIAMGCILVYAYLPAI